jgi:LPS-assembly lipoprotein
MFWANHRSVASLFFALCLGSCGFHLRGEIEFPEVMSVTYVDGDTRSELVSRMRRALSASGVRIVEDAEDARAILKMSGERTGRRVLSVGGGGKVSEYEVISSITFEVYERSKDSDKSSSTKDPRRLFRIKPQTVRLTRAYFFDETGVLGKSEEEEILRAEMRRDLVRLILFKIEASVASTRS